MSDAGEQNKPPSEPWVIPDGASPVRFMVATSEGRSYLSYRTLLEALADRNATMVFEADSGGQILLTCPVRHVHASDGVLTQLLTDLEMIAWGPGIDPDENTPFDAEIFFEHLPVGSGVGGGMGGGQVEERVWLHDELEELGLHPQIEAILAGKSERLNLPPKFPEVEFASLAELRPFPMARVLLCSSMRHHLLVDCLARDVRVDEGRLLGLIRQLDAVLENASHPLFTNVRDRRDPRLRFVPAVKDFERGGGHYVAMPLILGQGFRENAIEPLERNRLAITTILAGGDATIG